MTAIVPANPAWIIDVAPGAGSTYVEHEDGYLSLTGGGYAATPDFAALDGADSDTWLLVAADDWTTGATQALFSHYGAAPQRSYLVQITATGNLGLAISTTGTDSLATDKPATLVNGQPIWLRVARVGATGVTTFYFADGTLADPTDDWIVLGSATLSAGSPIRASTSALLLGARSVEPPTTPGTSPFTGKLYAAFHYVNGVLVASPDYRTANGGEASIVDGQGHTFTNYGAAAIVGEVDEVILGAATLTDCLLTVDQTSVLPAATMLLGGVGGGTGDGTGTGGLGVDWTATGGLDTVRAALEVDEAQRAVDIVVLGDSITEGAAASTEAGSWAEQLLAVVRDGYQPAGVLGGGGFQRAWHNVGTSPWDPWTRTGGVELSDSGLGLKAYRLDTVGDSMSATFRFTTLDLFFRQLPGGGLVDVTIDGVTETVDLSGADASGQSVRFDGYASGDHTVVIENVSGVNVIEGVFRWDGDETNGIRLWNGGHGGFRAVDFAKAPTLWADTLAAIPNPALVIVTLGINDYNGGRTPGQLASNLAAIVATIRSVAADASIVVVSMYQDGVTTQGTPWDAYEAAIEEMVRADTDLNLFDLRPRVGDYAEFYVDGAVTVGSPVLTSAACDFTGVTVGTLAESDKVIGSSRVLPDATTVVAVLDAHTVQLSANALQTATGLPFILRRTVNANFDDTVHPSDTGHDLWSDGLSAFLLP